MNLPTFRVQEGLFMVLGVCRRGLRKSDICPEVIPNPALRHVQGGLSYKLLKITGKF